MSETANPPEGANLPEFSVSEISAALKRMVEDSFPFVRVRGEISGLKFASSGHVYFDLKDDKAVINAIIWRGVAQKLKHKPESGVEVVVTGRITTYPGSSRYQIIVERLELAGLGALMALLEQRKKKLAAEGLFAAGRKRPLPFLPEVIGVISSPTGAVIRDIMHRLTERFPRRVILWPVAVQGERAAAEIAAAIEGFNTLEPGGKIPRPDVLIVARGGGSIEDLMAFNEEIVVRAAAASAIPLISAVGHETDTTLIDFASDRRAPTPTAAAEIAVPVRADLLGQVMDLARRQLGGFTRAMSERRARLQSLVRVLPRAEALFAPPRQRLDYAAEKLGHALRRNLQVHRTVFARNATLLRPRVITQTIRANRERVNALEQRLARAHGARVSEAATRLDNLVRVLDSVSYKSVLERGFVLVRSGGDIRRRAASVKPDEILTLTFADGTAQAIAKGASDTPPPRPAAKKAQSKGQGDLFKGGR